MINVMGFKLFLTFVTVTGHTFFKTNDSVIND